MGVPLTEAQQSRDGKRMLVKGLKDANGKVFDEKVNSERNKLDFFREKKVVDVEVEEKVAEKKGRGRKV